MSLTLQEASPYMLAKGVIMSIGICLASSAYANTPTLNLLTSSVVEGMSQSSKTAKAVETSAAQTIQKLERQAELFKQSHCEGATSDQGCDELKTMMNETYMDLLTTVEGGLPELRNAFDDIAINLGKRIHNEIGQKLTMRDLQRIVAGKSSISNLTSTNSMRKGRMSDMISRWHGLVTQNRTAGSIPSLAASIYVDSVNSRDFLDVLETEIQTTKLELSIRDTFTGFSPDMEQVVSNVKSFLLGEEANSYGISPIETEASNAHINALLID